MLRRTLLGVLVLASALVVFAPSPAKAQVAVGVTVGAVFPRPYVVAPPAYGYAVAPVPYVPAPYVAVAPGYVYPRYYYRPGWAFIGGRWYPRSYGYRHPGRPGYWRR